MPQPNKPGMAPGGNREMGMRPQQPMQMRNARMQAPNNGQPRFSGQGGFNPQSQMGGQGQKPGGAPGGGMGNYANQLGGAMGGGMGGGAINPQMFQQMQQLAARQKPMMGNQYGGPGGMGQIGGTTGQEVFEPGGKFYRPPMGNTMFGMDGQPMQGFGQNPQGQMPGNGIGMFGPGDRGYGQGMGGQMPPGMGQGQGQKPGAPPSRMPPQQLQQLQQMQQQQAMGGMMGSPRYGMRSPMPIQQMNKYQPPQSQLGGAGGFNWPGMMGAY